MSIERLKEFLRIHRENNVKDEVLAVDIFTDETIEKLFTDLPKLLALVQAGDVLADEVAKLADYWGKTCDAMLALERYRKAKAEL